MVVAADRELLGREDELLRLRELVSSLPHGPRAITLRGEPGIGKTIVWRAGLERAQTACRLLSARCVEAELPLALVGLTDLARDAFGDAADELTEHERAVLASTLELSVAARDGLALPLAFLALLRVLARNQPVLIAVDDVQWLDPASARILSFAARRLGDLPIGIVVTQRGDGPDPLDLEPALGAAYEELSLGPLSIGAIAHLVRSRYDTSLPRPVLARVHEASGGNPMFALEFARSLDRTRSHFGPITIPRSLQDLVQARVEGYPDDVRRLLAIVAAAERSTPRLLAEVEPGATELLAAAVDLDAVTIDDGLIRFTHPLLGSAAYGDLTPAARRSLHAELAQACENAEDRARHVALATAEPNAAAARLLDEAVAAALARGAPETAAELAQEALRLIPPGKERFEGTLSAAWHLSGAGRYEDARALLKRLLEGSLEDPQRARVLVALARLADDVDGGEQLNEALALVGADVALRAEVLLQLCGYQLYRGDLAASEASARQAVSAAEEAREGALVAAAHLFIADRADLAGRPEPDVASRAASLAREHGLPVWCNPPREFTGRRLLRSGDLNGARDALEAELKLAFEQGALPDRYRLIRDLADVERHAGRWRLSGQYVDQAEEYADAGVRRDRWAEAELAQRRAALTVLSGPVEAARDLLAQGIAFADGIHWPHLAATNRWGVGALDLSLCDPAQAWQALSDIPGTETWGRLEVVEAVADAIEALVGLGELAAADTLQGKLHDDRDRGHLWAGPGSLRSAALLLLARGRLEEALPAAQEAAARFEERGFPLHAARSLLVAGEALRRAGERRRAGDTLDAARSIFRELGAPRWVARCETELRRARPRPRRDGELTHAERRVAALVAQGKKNREVAAQLFTTVSTVEAHLTRIYRKLDIRSRTELTRVVADGQISLEDD